MLALSDLVVLRHRPLRLGRDEGASVEVCVGRVVALCSVAPLAISLPRGSDAATTEIVFLLVSPRLRSSGKLVLFSHSGPQIYTQLL